MWLILTLAGLALVKIVVIDPRTTLFRCVSTEHRVCGAETTARASFAARRPYADILSRTTVSRRATLSA